MKRFEYISSGNYLFHYTETFKDKSLISEIQDDFIRIETKDHSFSYLYNAFMDERIGMRMYEDIDRIKIYADSGGLQVVTLGKTVDDAFKKQIYKTQALHAHYGFCFDEIPVETPEGGSSLINMENRYFDHAMVEECAKKTAKNIVEQIEEYRKHKSSTKAMAIIQGNCKDSYMKWAEVLEREIPDDIKIDIAGVAMAATSLGRGTLEDIEKAFTYAYLPISFGRKHLHLLAVGSYSRMKYTLMCLQSGLYPDDLKVSYDSTSVLKSFMTGRYHTKEGKIIYLSRDVCSPNFDIAAAEINEAHNLPHITPDLLYYFGKTNSRAHMANGGTQREYISFINKCLSTITQNQIRLVERCAESPKALARLFAKEKTSHIYSVLHDMKKESDFDKFMLNEANDIKSSRVPSIRRNTLDDFDDNLMVLG